MIVWFFPILVTDILSDIIPKTAWDFLIPGIVGGFVILLCIYQFLKYVLNYDLLTDL